MTSMPSRTLLRIVVVLFPLAASACAPDPGRLSGRVIAPASETPNTPIRMTADPACLAMHADVPAMQDVLLRSADGGLANAFVYLKGTFPAAPVPATPIEIDQRGCLYRPRVQGARVGQGLKVRSSDELLHSIRGRSGAGNDFALSQPHAGMVGDATLKHAEVMLRVRCDVHNWMRAYIGVVEHPYFAVSDPDGRFALESVPPGTYTLVAWHEALGTREFPVEITPKGDIRLDVDFGKLPASAALQLPVEDIVVHAEHGAS